MDLLNIKGLGKKTLESLNNLGIFWKIGKKSLILKVKPKSSFFHVNHQRTARRNH